MARPCGACGAGPRGDGIQLGPGGGQASRCHLLARSTFLCRSIRGAKSVAAGKGTMSSGRYSPRAMRKRRNAWRRHARSSDCLTRSTKCPWCTARSTVLAPTILRTRRRISSTICWTHMREARSLSGCRLRVRCRTRPFQILVESRLRLRDLQLAGRRIYRRVRSGRARRRSGRPSDQNRFFRFCRSIDWFSTTS